MSEVPLYVIGVDAGGTKTRAVLADATGQPLTWGLGGPGNPTRVSPVDLRSAYQQAIHGVLTDAAPAIRRQIKVVYLGVAGATGNEAIIREAVGDAGLDARIVVDGDVQIAFASAIRRPYGVIVIAGTGANAYGVGQDGREATASGRGYLIGDEGSGYAIGRAGLMAAMQADDGRGPPTLLLDRMLDFFDVASAEAVIHPIYAENGKRHISRFAPVVTQAAQAGDAVARQIVADAGRELGKAALAVARRVNLAESEFELALVGSVFAAGDALIAPLRTFVLSAAPHAEIVVSKHPPVLGAVRRALALLGIETLPIAR